MLQLGILLIVESWSEQSGAFGSIAELELGAPRIQDAPPPSHPKPLQRLD